MSLVKAYFTPMWGVNIYIRRGRVHLSLSPTLAIIWLVSPHTPGWYSAGVHNHIPYTLDSTVLLLGVTKKILVQAFFRRPGQSQGLLYKQLHHWLIDLFSESWFVRISLRCRHTLMGEDGAFSNKIDFVILEILNLKMHPNRITCSKVMGILLNGWILPIGGVA